jgi:hypothetical protein
MAGCCENGDKHSGSIKHGEFIDTLKSWQLLKKEFVPRTCLVSQITVRSGCCAICVRLKVVLKRGK